MSIQDDVNKLYRAGAKRIVLDEIGQRPAIPAKVGVGEYQAPTSSGGGGSVAATRTEVLTVYSHLIITEDGAFERPSSWPSDGAYPSGTAIPSPLPGSLINDGGTLKLDTTAQYYEQKRAHLVGFDSDAGLQEDHYLVPLAAPFAADGYYQGITRHATGVYSPTLYLQNATSGLSTAASDRVAELITAGIGYE